MIQIALITEKLNHIQWSFLPLISFNISIYTVDILYLEMPKDRRSDAGFHTYFMQWKQK